MERAHLSEGAHRGSAKKYGYLAKMFTVFGMHVHIRVPDADEAIRICAWLTQRAPLFIALSANSPCWQGEDSGFCSARSNVVGAFPMSGTMPFHIRTWNDFSEHFERLAGHGIVNSIKDFYWDVRPKPEYGTVELRVLDTPLHPAYSAALGSYRANNSSKCSRLRPSGPPTIRANCTRPAEEGRDGCPAFECAATGGALRRGPK